MLQMQHGLICFQSKRALQIYLDINNRLIVPDKYVSFAQRYHGDLGMHLRSVSFQFFKVSQAYCILICNKLMKPVCMLWSTPYTKKINSFCIFKFINNNKSAANIFFTIYLQLDNSTVNISRKCSLYLLQYCFLSLYILLMCLSLCFVWCISNQLSYIIKVCKFYQFQVVQRLYNIVLRPFS